ncbi:hypothetical protein [Cellulosimicrobium cellulans]|uniref:hypothetical protein n=1 Tax=Cellulosimicrobium cellulans TaxID=1710 RepID=UPI0002F08876|nr:hypothetical protein [Cellulosimicrobium cellulans]
MISDEPLYPWETCGRDAFDRAVELLLQRKHQAGPGTAQAVDGRGGDGGIDVDVTEPDDTISTIYQLKYFPEGFSGGFSKTRRSQIKKSFLAAMKHRPASWVLVVPRNPTPKERAWVRSLKGKNEVRVTILARDALDLMLTQAPDIFRALTSGPLTEALRMAGNEHLALNTAADLERVARGFSERVNSRSVFWAADMILGADGSVTQRLVPKRPDAQEKEPLSVIPHFSSSPAGEEARAKMEELHSFGGAGLHISADALVSVKLEGPQWFSQDVADVAAIGFGPVGMSRDVDVELRAVTASGATLQSLDGRSRMSRGSGGKKLWVELTCGLGFEFVMQDDVEKGLATVTSKLEGLPATDVAYALKFMDRFVPGAELNLELWAEGRRLFLFNLPDAAFNGMSPDGYTRQLIEDLAVLSWHFLVPLRLPNELTWAEREEIRKARLVVDGKVVAERDFQNLEVVLSGKSGAPIEGWLQSEAMMVVVETEVHYLVQGHRLPIRAKIFHPRAQYTEPQAVLDALQAGTAEGMPARIRGVDGTPFRVFRDDDPDRDPAQPLAAEPLGIIEPEPSEDDQET